MGLYQAREEGNGGLRREGLYHSHVIEWCRARGAGALNALAVKPSGPKPEKTAADKENERLAAKLARVPRPSWGRREKRCRAWEKRTRSWRCSPRARVSTPSRRSDRRGDRRAGAGPGHPGRVPGDRQVAGEPAPAAESAIAETRSSPAAGGASGRVVGVRTGGGAGRAAQ